MTGRLRMRYDVKRERILEVAEEIFAEKGYRSTTLNEIADRVNIKTPGLYYYFKSKSDIYNSLLMEVYFHLAEKVLEPVKNASDLREKIRLLVVLLVDFWSEHPGFPRIIAREALTRSRFIDEEFIPNFLVPMFEELVNALGEGKMEAHGFRDLDMPLLVYNVLGMTMFYFISNRMYSTLAGEDSLSPARVSVFKEEVLVLVFQGIEADPARKG